ncbi:LUD domain-containing protein [Tepidiforma sp.]|uniref:LUD domain-containing protein n=1 Tax=Tepidiforma sp. TaxID=2682230 RepID=UPI002ADE64E7|nr:LUD domain-containing protein [Tepidiforma sp.]
MTAFRRRAAREIAEARPAETLQPIMRKLVDDARAMLARGPADARERAARARADAVERIEPLHRQLREQCARRGIGYHRAATAEEAVAIVRQLLGNARRVAKSKSMVAEEIGLTHALRAAGIDVLETDIGEYIVDLEGRGPSHVTAPAIHLNRTRIREILARAGAELPDDDPARLSRHIRDIVADFFRTADAAITGANAVIAASGRIVAVENEGNVALGISHPALHIVVTGLEKVVADEAAALAVLQVLAPSATAQPLTAFTHVIGDPLPGQQRHLVVVDNGRSRILADPRYRDALRCIRCGACMNACPVYRAASGLAYGSPYMGPIGAVISPLLWPGSRHADLPFASTLCAACTEACPVGIPLHRMLLDLRADAVRTHRAGDRKERAAWAAWAALFSAPTGARAASALARVGLRAAGRLVRPPAPGRADPRLLPEPAAPHDPALLGAAAPDRTPRSVIAPEEVLPPDLAGRFLARAEALGLQPAAAIDPIPGDLELAATAAVASTGSVLITGPAADRRRLLSAARVILRVDPATIVEHPAGLQPYLGDGDALILTGPSRTADIEKVIVRGIHGSQDYRLVLEQPVR